MRKTFWAALPALALLAACANAGHEPSSGGEPSARVDEPKAEAVAFDLYTHCGVRELTVDGKYYERVGGPLTDGNGNPPSGWGNPNQPGQLLVTEESAVFTDDYGHREEFRLREGATDFLVVCS